MAAGAASAAAAATATATTATELLLPAAKYKLLVSEITRLGPCRN
jgi:hypothetical protein